VRRTPIALAAGGTAGHVVPALAVAEALSAEGVSPDDLVFVGSERGIERELVVPAGFELVTLPGRGIGRGAGLARWSALGRLAMAGAVGLRLLLERRVEVVVGFGGWAAASLVAGAVVLRRPVVLVEPNAVPGRVNRVLAPFARHVAVAFPGCELPHAVVTGNPLRSPSLEVDRSPEGRRAAVCALELDPDRPCVVVVGGSLGARRINEATRAMVSAWSGPPCSVVHVVGRRDFDEGAWTATVQTAAGIDYRAVAFTDRMPTLLAAADLVVARSGAATVAELAAAGVPSILVPLPGAPGDHQGANARALAREGAAVVVPDDGLDGERLGALVAELLADPESLAAMGRAAKRLARPDAAAEVARLVLEVRRSRGGTGARRGVGRGVQVGRTGGEEHP